MKKLLALCLMVAVALLVTAAPAKACGHAVRLRSAYVAPVFNSYVQPLGIHGSCGAVQGIGYGNVGFVRQRSYVPQIVLPVRLPRVVFPIRRW